MIYRAKDFVDAYRARALSRDINDMSGRDGQPDITRHISECIAEELGLEENDSLVDVGCGDGTLIKIAIERGLDPRRVIGVLPTVEEVDRVRERFATLVDIYDHRLIIAGFSNDSHVPSGFANKCVCNGVFLLLQNMAIVEASISELVRITSSGGLILIGEVPEISEANITSDSGAMPVTTSALQRAVLVFRQFGIRELITRLRKRCVAEFGSRLIVLAPPLTFFISPADFENCATRLGLKLIKKYRSPSLSSTGRPHEIPYRWTYIFERH